ncbi:NADH-quinone oxidoreductase subunit C [Adhaeribacter arboris]|uniref:NADH-quinone oxidoreductase subunit C n=1 Tax=Adhaeribacter arboris TaxID=2072846 RepID=A0A2T2YM76_9BACT|nr:NADH-quinone oxidoreductase subunit C [Adhaeribacter arboris]PSR56612.1 NADH-quinone oxidoreductase subunit C [Adhaeribacter arboris]
MEPLTNQILLENLTKKFGDSLFDIWEPYGLLTLTTTRDSLLPLLEYLYHDEYMQMNFLTTMCGVHYPEKQDAELGVVYHVHSLVHNVRIRIKIFFPIEDPRVPTLTNLYSTANWMERETYDFYGVIFEGHPNLIRILNVEDMNYHPLRKQYALEDGTREDKVDTFFGR